MNDENKSAGSILAVIAIIISLVVGGFALTRSNAPAPVTDNEPTPGAVASPDVQGPYYSVNGLATYKYHTPMTKNASTTCAMKSPAATSTLVTLAYTIASSSSAATIWELGTAVNPFSTTTLIGTKYNVAAGAQAAVVGSTTPSTGYPILAPNTWVNLKIGAPAAGFPLGYCDSEFIVL